tara:strand:- start:13405 stop:13551 length:147 start_codon:yes stop_codon:yes gene_type:complete
MEDDLTLKQHLKEWSDLIKRLKILPKDKFIDYRIQRIEHLIHTHEVST